MKAGWEVKTLGEVCEMYQPKTISVKDMIADGAYPVFGANGVIGRYDKFNHEEPQLLITCRGATCGSVNISDPKSWITGNAMVVKPKANNIQIKFLEYYFRGGVEIQKAITGAAQPQITRTNLEPLNISFPTSVAQQQRIVAILDQVFEGIAKARANAEQNLQNAQNIYMSVLDKLFSDLSNSTKPAELRDFIDVLTDYHANGSYETLKQHVELKESEDYAWMVRSTDFENNFENDKRYIDKHAYDYLTKSCIVGGEIIMSKIGNAGKVYLMPEITRPCSLAMNLFLIRLNAKLSSKFVYYFLKTSNGTSQIKSRLQGAATQTITKENVRNLLIPVCSQEKQAEIVSRIESLYIETQRLESLYQRKIACLDELKKSLLQQAFAGEL
jgi:type I restriction enzyme S subunit